MLLKCQRQLQKNTVVTEDFFLIRRKRRLLILYFFFQFNTFFFLKIIGKNFAALLGVERKICKNVLLMYIHCTVTAWAECPTFL